MTRVEITYGNETVVMTWNGADASAPIFVDGWPTGWQTADARHHTANAVLLVARRLWPEETWPEDPRYGDDAIETTEAWDDLAYETLDE